MNKYQKIAFGAFGLLLLALMIGATQGLDGLKVAVIVTLVVALLTLATTWKLIYGFIQVIGASLGFVGHGIGKTGDWTADMAYSQRHKLSMPRQASQQGVPDWDSPELVTVGAKPASSDNLDVPDFMRDVMDRQN